MVAEDTKRGLPWRALLAVFLTALLVRMLYFLEHLGAADFGVPLLDQLYYHLFAEAIVAGDDLSRFGGFRPILYPVFLACCYLVAAGAETVFAIFVQHMLGCMTALLVALIAWLGSGRRDAVALAAGVLYAFAPTPLFYEGELLIESFMAFLCAVMLLVVAVALSTEGRRAVLWWLGAGLMAGLAAQARPNMLLFFPAFGVVAVVCAVWRRSPAPLVMLWALVGIVVVQVAFGFVNKQQSGRFQLVTSAGGINFYVGNNPRADGMIPKAAYSTTYTGQYQDSIAEFAEVAYRKKMEERGEIPSDDPSEISDFWYAETWREIRGDRGRWAGLIAKKVALLLTNYEIPSGESFGFSRKHDSMLLKVLPVRWCVLMVLAPVGVMVLWHGGQRRLLAYLILFLVLYGASIALFFVNGRFRIPMWPAVVVLAGCGVERLWRAARESSWESIRGGVGTGVFLGVFSLGTSLLLVPEENFSRAFYFRSLAQFQTGNYAGALEDMERSASLDELSGDMLLHLGNVRLALGDAEGALEAYERALLLEPDEPRILNNIGAAHEKRGDFQRAYESYLEALALYPTHRTALVNAALLELRAGFVEEAAARIDAALSAPETGNRVSLLVAQGLLANERGNGDAANRFLNEAAAINRQATEDRVSEFRDKIVLELEFRPKGEASPREHP